MMNRNRLLIPALNMLAVGAAATAARGQQQPFEVGDFRPATVEFVTEVIDVPMKYRGTMPAIEAKVNGQGPFLFALDTGASGCISVDKSLTDKLNLPVVGEVQGTDGSRSKVLTFDLVKVDSIEIGGATFETMEGMSHDFNALGAAMIGRIDGIIGITMFHDCLLTLDYKNERVRIERGALPSPNGQTVLALDEKKPIPALTIRVGDQECLSHVDSGNMGAIRLPQAVAKSLPLGPVTVLKGRTVTSDVEVNEARLEGAIHVGRFEVENPVIQYTPGYDTGNVGSNFLREFVTTVDWTNRRIRFEREETGAIRTAKQYRIGVMFVPDPAGLKVRGTAPGSAGEKAGLREGDVVTAINGKPYGEFESNVLREVFGSPVPVQLMVKRGDKTLEMTVTPQAAD